jgi:hypothetical protein
MTVQKIIKELRACKESMRLILIEDLNTKKIWVKMVKRTASVKKNCPDFSVIMEEHDLLQKQWL